MKKTYSKSSRQGLPGGPNEMFEKVKGIIVSERGQWDFPGMNTLVPTDDGRITMRGVPYPVYGQDETGYGQMMYPGQEYQFPGNNVLELPVAQKGGALPQFQGVARSQVPTYSDSLDLYKNTVALENFLRSKKAYLPNYRFTQWKWKESHPRVGGSRVSNWYDLNSRLSNRDQALDYLNKLYDEDISDSQKSLPRNHYIKRKNNLIGSRDWAVGGYDDKNLPVSYIHPQIKPQFEGDTSIPGEGMFYMYRYDPVAIKPGALLTPKELALRLKKYGKRGIPQSKIDEYYASKNPVTPIVTPPADIIDINKSNQQTPRKEFVRNISQSPVQLGPNQYEDRVRLITPLHEYMMNLDQYSKLLPTDSIPQQGNFLYRLNRQQLGGALPQFQYTGQFNPQLARPNPLTGKYAWEQNIPKKTAVNVAPKMQPAARATTNVQKQNLNLDRDNRLLDANLIYSDASSNPLSNAVHTGLDAVGMVPLIGEPADLANALLYNYEGDLENTALSTAGMIPFLGMLGTGKRLLGKATNQLEGYSKGLKQLTPKKEYLTGEYKHHAINELKKTALAFSPSTVKALGKLDPAIAQKMLEDYRFGNYPSIEDFRKNVKKATLESERLKKIHPTVDFGKLDENYNWGLKKPETLKQYADIQLMKDKSEASQKSFMNYLEKEYSKKMDLINQNEVFKNIANESPQYTDLIYEHLKNPKISDDEFVTNLVKQANTFTRSIRTNPISPEEFFTLKGRSMLEGNKNTIDLEGFPVSGDYGNFRYKIEPNAQRISEISAIPIEERWGQRFPDNFTDNNINVNFNQGWHNQQSEAYNNWWRKRLERNRNTDNVPMIEYPKKFNVPVKYVVYPQHQVATSILDNQILKGFDASIINIENPYKHIPGFTRGYSLGGSLPKAQMLGEFNPQLFQPNPLTGLYNWEKPRVKPKLSDFEPKQKAAPRSSTSVATKSDPVKAARQINAAAAEEYERNRQGVIRATNRPVSVFRPGAGDPEAIMEFTGVPGAVRFVKSPVQSLKGAGNTIVDLGLTVSPFANMNPAAGFQYAKQGTNPLTGEGSFRPQDVEGAFNTLDAAGLATIVGAGLKAPLQQGLKQTGKYLTQGPLRNAYKLRSSVLKENPEMFLYRARPVGQDINMNMAAQIRAKQAAGEPLTWYQKNLLNPQTNPQLLAREKYYGRWFEKDPNRLDWYIDPETRNFADQDAIEILRTRLPKSEAAKLNISQFPDAKVLSASPETEFILPEDMVNTAERFAESSWQQLIQEDKVFNTPHWWRGYGSKTPKQLPGSPNVNQPVGNIFSKFKKIPDWVISEMRFNALPELNNKQANEVLENFRARIKTPEGQKKLKELGITDTRILDDLKILADDETLGHYWMQKIGLNPHLPEMKRVTRHEIEHAVQEARNISLMNKFNQDDGNFKYLFRPKKRKLALEEARRETTDIDELLKGLELRKTPENVDWNAIKSTRGKLDASRLFEYMSDKQRATNYFNSGSGGQEKSAFLAEVQQYMMDNNIIPKNSYVEVTPEMVKETFVDAMFDETGGGKYLRLFNIMKPTEANYKLISEGLNKMLGLAPFIGTGLGVYGVNQMQNAQPTMQRFGGNLKFQKGGIKKLSPYGELQMYPTESGAGVLGEVGLDYQLPFGNSAYLSNSFNVEPGYGSYFNPGFGIEQPIGGNRGSFFMGAEMFDGAPRLNAGLKYRFEDGGSLPTAGDPVLNFIQSQSPRFSKSKK